MFMKQFIVIIFSICSLYSCTSSDECDFRYNKFNKTIEVDNIHEIKIDTYIKSADFALMDSFLIVRDIYSREYFFHVFDRKTLSYITTTGRVGSGPGEITKSGPILTDEKNKCFYGVDYAKAALHTFMLDSLSKSFLPSIYSKFKNGMAFTCIEQINDSIAITNNVDITNPNRVGNIVLSYLNLITGTFTKINYRQCAKIFTSDSYTSMFNFSISPNKNYCAIGYFQSDIIDILNLNTLDQIRIIGPLGINGSKNTISTPETYSKLYCTNKYIFALYIGTPVIDRKTRKILHSKYIQVFDYAGHYIKTLYLKEGFSRGFCVDEENNRIIASSDYSENSLIYFDIDL